MGEEANAVLQHAQHLGPLDHSMQREALVCKEGYCYWYVSGISVVCWCNWCTRACDTAHLSWCCQAGNSVPWQGDVVGGS